MNKISPRNLKGFRDFLPSEARKRQYVIETLKKVFESYGFEPLETPALEYDEILSGKYGDEGEKLMYKFEDNGGRKVAMRYDQTVPLARVVAQYQNEITLPFKRYQISNVWRGDNPQAGRFREFTQCDIDTVGTTSALADAEIIIVAAKALDTLGFKDYTVLFNDRKNLSEIGKKATQIIDKIKKIGWEKVEEELKKEGMDTSLLKKISSKTPTDNIDDMITYLGMSEVGNKQYKFEPTLARGLDYYTGLIFEIEVNGYSAGSVCGGGRYDKLIGMFKGQDIPAVGCAFGFDRIIEAMDKLKLFPDELFTTKALVTVFSKELEEKSIKVSESLRSKNITAEVYLDPDTKMEKQLKYADQKGIPYAVIIGPKEAESGSATVKNLKTGEQKTVPADKLADLLQ